MIVPGSSHQLFGGTKPEITLLGTALGTYDIGPARPDRIVVIAGQREQDASGAYGNFTITGFTVNGVYRGASSDPMGMDYALVPTGTTVTVSGGSARWCVWLITGVTQLEQTLTGTVSGTDVTMSGTFSGKPAAVLAISRSRSVMNSGSVSSTGLVRGHVLDTTNNSGSGASGWIASHANVDGAGAGALIHTSANAYSAGIGAAGVFTM